MSSGLTREPVDERSIEESGDDGCKEDEPHAQKRHEVVRGVVRVAVVLVAGEELGEAEDQLAEGDSAQTGADSGSECQTEESG